MAVGWFIHIDGEGVVGAFETREDAEAYNVELHPDEEYRQDETQVLEVGFLGPLNRRISDLETELAEKSGLRLPAPASPEGDEA